MAFLPPWMLLGSTGAAKAPWGSGASPFQTYGGMGTPNVTAPQPFPGATAPVSNVPLPPQRPAFADAPPMPPPRPLAPPQPAQQSPADPYGFSSSPAFMGQGSTAGNPFAGPAPSQHGGLLSSFFDALSNSISSGGLKQPGKFMSGYS